MTTVHVKTGTEGPRHDPYGFTEITVDGRNGKVTFHSGLSTWLTQNTAFSQIKYTGDEVTIAEFERLVGVTPQVAYLAVLRNKQRKVRRHLRSCPKRKEVYEADGYPGESLLICGCGSVLDSHFDISAVE